MFLDRAKIYVRSGDGGDGMISFRREKYVSLGGPDGGDGGNGGDVIIEVNPKLNSLSPYKGKVHFRADHGKHGVRKNMSGKRGSAVVLQVPPGTVIRNSETQELLADMTEEDQNIVLLKGGRGGKGNQHYASSRNQAPRIAERGEPGEERWLSLELKLIADIGLAGKPNAGKSTLLSVISEAKPKVASYPFTTLQPSLGVVHLDDYETMVVADIPGLIEGAASGVGLGHDFLRHIERNKMLIHLLDGTAAEPLEDFAMINQELALYDSKLMEKPQLVVLNKMDMPDAVAWEPLVEEVILEKGFVFCSISAITRQGVREMLYKAKQMLDAIPEKAESTEDDVIVIKPPVDEEAFTIERDIDGAWRVHGVRIERVASMTYFEFDATALRFQRIMDSMGITKALEDAGIVAGEAVRIGETELEWGDE